MKNCNENKIDKIDRIDRIDSDSDKLAKIKK
jgi:hypothetical protein